MQSIKLLTSINKTTLFDHYYFSKKDIINYNLNKKIPFLQDPTNTNLYYTRPSIRDFLKETSRKNTNDIINDFNQILKYSKLYNVMISEILIYNLNNIDKNKITFKFENFVKIENLILEKITKKIYIFLLATEKILRSKKIQIFLSHINNQNFRSFNLGGMIIKKSNNLLVFSKNSN